MYCNLSQILMDKYNFESDKQRYYTGTSPKNIARHVDGGKTCNAFTIRIAWSVTCWDFRYLEIAKHMAENFNKYLIHKDDTPISSELTTRVPNQDYGYEFYKE